LKLTKNIFIYSNIIKISKLFAIQNLKIAKKFVKKLDLIRIKSKQDNIIKIKNHLSCGEKELFWKLFDNIIILLAIVSN